MNPHPRMAVKKNGGCCCGIVAFTSLRTCRCRVARSLARQFALAATANGLAVNLVRLCCGGVLRLLQVPLPSSSLFGKIESQQRRAEQSFLVLRERNSAEMARVGNAPAARTRARLLWAIPEKERGTIQGRRGTEPSLTTEVMRACGRRHAAEGH